MYMSFKTRIYRINILIKLNYCKDEILMLEFKHLPVIGIEGFIENKKRLKLFNFESLIYNS